MTLFPCKTNCVLIISNGYVEIVAAMPAPAPTFRNKK